MADEIRQDLGFDAAQALETINKLNTGFDTLFQTLSASPRAFDSFNQRGQDTINTLLKIQAQVKQTTAALSSVGTVAQPGVPGGAPNAGAQAAAAQQLTQSINQATTASNQLNTAVTNTGNATTNALNKSTRSAAGFALSLETITRVLGTQLIVRALGGIQRGIEASFGNFIELQNGLATLRTISTDTLGTLEKELVGLSNAFNVPLLEVVQAKYEILQNGFESTAESVDILTASLKFSRIANTDVAQSADLVSSSLNAYGQAASSAETLTAKLVETIQLGRIKGQELVNALGRVSPIAKELGVSMDEVLASFSSITIGATRTSEAATQIRATLSALLKPSEAMKEAFKKLGIETGDQAIQTFGYKGALEALIGTTNGSTHAISQLFPNVRAVTGVLREAGSGAAVFDDHLKQIRATAESVLNKKFELRITSDAETVTADFNKFKNFLTTEIGRSLVATTAKAVEFVGGIDNVAAAAGALAPAVGVASAALIAYSVVVGATTAANRLLTISWKEGNIALKAFGGALLTASLAFAAFESGKGIGQAITNKLNEGQKKVEQESQQILQNQREQEAARAQLQQQADQDRFQELNRVVAKSRSAYFQTVEDAKAANQDLIANDKSALDRIIEAHDHFAQDLRRAAQKAEDQVIDSRKTSNDEIIKLEDERFNKQIANLSAFSKFQDQDQRAEQLFARGKKQLLKANTDEEVKAARATLDRSDAFRQQALESAKVLGSTSLVANEERRIEQIAQERIKAELRFQKIKEGDAQRLRQEAAKEEERVGKLKILASTFLDKAKLFDSSGNKLPQETITKNVKEAQLALRDFQKLAFDKSAKFSIADLVSFDSLQRRLESTVGDADIQRIQATPKSLDDLVNQIQGAIDKENFVIRVAAELGIDTEQFKDLSKSDALNEVTKAIQDQKDQVDKLREGNVHRLELERAIAAQQQLAARSFDQQQTKTESAIKFLQRATDVFPGVLGKFTPDQIAVQQDQINQFRALIQKAISEPGVTAEFVNNLADDLNKFSRTASVSLNLDISKAAREFNNLRTVVEKRQELGKLDKSGLTPEALNKAEENLKNTAIRVKAEQDAAEALKASQASTAAAAANSLSWAAQAKAVEQSSAVIATNFTTAAQAMIGLTSTPNGIATPTIQPSAQIATQAPVTATPQSSLIPQVPGATNVSVTQNITSNDPQQIARDLIPAINREIRRNASALRTA